MLVPETRRMLLLKVLSDEIEVTELKNVAKSYGLKQKIQNAFIHCLKLDSWEQVMEK